MRVKNVNEASAGLFLVLVALMALYLSWPLSSGTEVGLGPGYVPKMLAWALMAFGFLMVGDSMRGQAQEASQPWAWRSMALVLGSVVFFAVAIERLGLVLALSGLILISAAGSQENRLLQSLLLAAGAVAFSVVVFVKALGLSLRVWPPFV